MYVCMYSYVSVREAFDIWSIFKQILTGLDSVFLLLERLPYQDCYLPIAGGKIIGFIPFLRVLESCDMQTVSFIHVTVSISSNGNHYTSNTSLSLSLSFSLSLSLSLHIYEYIRRNK